MKTRNSLSILLTLLIVATVALTACTGKSDKIVVATDATWPPMEFVDEDKNIVGFDIDLMNAIAKEGGFTVEYKNVAWDGIFAGLAAGEYDAVMSSVTIQADREEQGDFSEPYLNAGQVIVVQTAFEFAGIESLSGKVVGSQISTTGAFEVQKMAGVESKEYDEIGLAFEDLNAGRISAVVCDTPVAADFALQREEYKAKLKIVGEPLTSEELGILVESGNTELMEKINAGLQAVKDNGTLAELEDKWLR